MLHNWNNGPKKIPNLNKYSKEENYIKRELIPETEIIKTGQLCPELPREIRTNEEMTEKKLV